MDTFLWDILRCSFPLNQNPRLGKSKDSIDEVSNADKRVMQEQSEYQQQKHRSNKNKKTRVKKVRKLLYRIVKNRLEAEIKP